MNKLEYYKSVFMDGVPFLFCPVCGADVFVRQNSLLCVNGHCADISAKGAVNLCYPHKKDALLYSKHLFTERKAVFEAGFFDVLIEKVHGLVRQNTSGHFILADMGCGEGSFLKRVTAGLDCISIGADISKAGIELAVSGDVTRTMWMVADIASMPVKNEVIDVIINILSPSNYSEFNRVLKKGGVIIKVLPGAEYLREFRNTILAGSEKQEYNNSVTKALFEKSLGPGRIITESLKYLFPARDMTEKIYNMSPLSGNRRYDDYPELRKINSLTLDFEIMVKHTRGFV